MDSKSLDHQAVKKLLAHVEREQRYFDKLDGRMHQKHFPQNDPVQVAVKAAHEAVRELSVQLHHLIKQS